MKYPTLTYTIMIILSGIACAGWYALAVIVWPAAKIREMMK